MKIGLIICHGSGASVEYGSRDGLDGKRLSHIVKEIMYEYKFPPNGYRAMLTEANGTYWPWSLRRIKRAVMEAADAGCDRYLFVGFSKGAMRITDVMNWLQSNADRGSMKHGRIVIRSGVLMIDYQRTIWNKDRARPRKFKARPAWLRYFRQEGSYVNPGVKRTMNGYPMVLPYGKEVVIREQGWYHNNIRHHPAIRQSIVDCTRWAFNQEEV